MDVAPKSKLESGNSLTEFDKTARMKKIKKQKWKKKTGYFHIATEK